jgi:hypothetical protein
MPYCHRFSRGSNWIRLTRIRDIQVFAVAFSRQLHDRPDALPVDPRQIDFLSSCP